MPIYEYRCCGTFEGFHLMKDSDKKTKCPVCGKVAKKLISRCNLVTDTNFVGTGKYDDRVCDGRDDKIEGRKDWQRRLDKKKLRVLDKAELEPKMPTQAPCM